MADYYKVLQVDQNAEHSVVEAAYKALAWLHNKDDRKMKVINAAKEVLLDKDRRQEYDAQQGAKKSGKVIGGYRIIKKIAEGGFGSTYLGEHIAVGSPVCIKHAHNISPTTEEILLEEAKNIWDLRHWGIPAMRDVLRMPDDSLALVMSYVPGKTLVEVFEANNPIEPEHVAWIMERILNVLKYLHMHGVIHGDLKPQNILVQAETHTITLVDYGLSQSRPTMITESKGHTPFFAAPELIEGNTPLPESDLYGLGMSMIFALGGDVEHVSVPRHVPAAMKEFIKPLVRLLPTERPEVWKVDLCEEIQKMRNAAFGRTASSMKPLKV